MELDDSFIAAWAKRLYMVKLLREITTGHSGSRIFEAEAGLRRYILRVSPFSEKKQAHAEFETRWTAYLASRMEGIAKPVRSVNGRRYEVMKAEGRPYILALQEKAPGKLVDSDDPDVFNQELFFHLGMQMGNMHKWTMRYEGNVACPEFQWNGPHFWRKDIAVLDEDVRQAETRLQRELEQLPMGKDSYGIVHFDIHTGNFLADHDKITIIDFEACQFNWYAADIASTLFFMVQKGAGPLRYLTEEARTAFAETYLISYLNGYFKTHTIGADWIRRLDLFMRYQMIDEYVAAQIGWPDVSDPMRQWYLDWHKNRLKSHQPYVFLDYEKILDQVYPVMQEKERIDKQPGSGLW